MDCCRVCIGNNINMVCLFDTSDIVDKIYFCTGIELAKNDGLPTKICNICLENLSIAYDFKNKCLQADKTLRSVVKVEKEERQENFCFIEINEMSCESEDDEDKDLDVKQDLVETTDIIETKNSEEKLEPKASIRKSSRVKLKDKNECLLINTEYISTARNGRKLLIDGYAYITDKKRGEITYWRCELKRKCCGRGKTVNDVNFIITKEHSHPPDPRRVCSLKVVNDIKQKAKYSDEDTSNILQSSLSRYPVETASHLAKKESLTRLIRRQRKSINSNICNDLKKTLFLNAQKTEII